MTPRPGPADSPADNSREDPPGRHRFDHGGAQIVGDFDQYEGVLAGYVTTTGVPFLSIDHTLAPQGRGTTQAMEGLTALRWLATRPSGSTSILTAPDSIAHLVNFAPRTT